MMGKGAEGVSGCDTNSNRGFTSFSQSASKSTMDKIRRREQGRSMDVFSQVFKVLALKPAFAEAKGAAFSAQSSALSVSENRRKQKVKKNDSPGGLEGSWSRDSSGHPFWMQMEEYFRNPTLEDLRLLQPKTKLKPVDGPGSLDSLLQIPTSGNRRASLGSIPESVPVSDPESLTKDVKQGTRPLKIRESVVKTKRKLSAASSVSKRRKLGTSSYEVITAVISPPENGDEELCHVCYGGDSDEQNQILFCDSCNVAVHQQCYGVEVVPEDQWMCALCEYRRKSSKKAQPNDSPDCALCPVKGGALKIIATAKVSSITNMSGAVYAHLFCSQWIPETYIGDMEKMEPVMNVEGVREERWKLLCSICKEKYGACIQCSHGTCATAFHPLCARQEKLRMEVSSKRGGDELEFRAFCSKHSMQTTKPSHDRQLLTEVGHETVDTNDLWHRMIKNPSNKGQKVTSMQSSISTFAGHDGDLVDGLDEENNGHNSTNGGADASFGRDEKPYVVNGESEGLCKSKGANAKSQKNDGHVPAKGENDMVNMENMDSSGNTILFNGQVEGRDVATEEKELLSCNEKNGSLKTYHNKRHKMQQNGRVPTRMKLKDDLTSGTVLREDVDLQQQTVNRDLLSAKNHINSNAVPSGADTDMMDSELTTEMCNNQDRPSLIHNGEQINSFQSLEKDLEIEEEFPSVIQGSSPFRHVDEAGSYIHPFILKRLMEDVYNVAERNSDPEPRTVPEAFPPYCKFRASASPCIEIQEVSKIPRAKRYQSKNSKPRCVSSSTKSRRDESFEAQIKQLEHAKKMGILDMSSQDEVEEEILALQMSLISCAEENHRRCEELVLKIIPCLSMDLRASLQKIRNIAVVNQYMALVMEAKKQGRKERRSKEAQAVLAAASAVATSSSRSGTLRKDVLASDDKSFFVRESFCTPSMPPSSRFSGVGSIARPGVLNSMGNSQSSPSQTSSCGLASSFTQDKVVLDSKNYGSELSSCEAREAPSLCDVCKDPARLTAIATCQRCKVTVHHQCYPSDGMLSGDWHCQPCSEILQHQGIKVTEVIDRATPGYEVVCSKCLQQSGAFKRPDNASRSWVHVFCAQWVSQKAAEKDETAGNLELKLEKNLQECCICHLKQGAHLRCSFGHCHRTFHPLCARDAGFYMIVKRSAGNRFQYRAYCDKHSPQQRQKADSKRSGTSEELTALLQMRAELERVRILCERVSKRERIKRDKLFCMMDWYTAQMCVLSPSAFGSTDYSAASNTQDTLFSFREPVLLITKPHGHESESYSWNSIASDGNRNPDTLSGDSVYQTPVSVSELSKETPARSQMSDAAIVQEQGRSTASANELKKPLKNQKAEILHTEMVMTPTEASVQNQRLPKGYAYVPVGVLPKRKTSAQETLASKDQ